MKQKDFLAWVKASPKAELIARRLQLSEELMKSRFKRASSQATPGHSDVVVRRSIARINTELAIRGA
jgi:ribosomal protein L29